MANGLPRLARRFLDEDGAYAAARQALGRPLDAAAASALGLVTFAPDEIDWDDEIRIALEERASLSPDALTGMEANLRFGGPETMETRSSGASPRGRTGSSSAPTRSATRARSRCTARRERPEFDWERV